MEARGFTLVELAVTVVVAGVLLALGIPTFQQIIERNRVATDINRLNASLQAARSTAIRSGGIAVVCPSADGRTCVGRTWEVGWISFIDVNDDGGCGTQSDPSLCEDGGRILEHVGALEGGTLRATGNARWRMRYTPRGTAPGYNTTFTRCSADGTQGSAFTVIATGRLRRDQSTASGCSTP